MKKMLVAAVAASFVSGMAVHAQQGPVVEAQPVDATAQTLPVNTLVLVTPAEEISSKKMKEGTQRRFLVVEDVVYGGKSAKFELSFDWVRVGSTDWRLRGQHRQEGKGNTAGTLLGSAIITGKSATMTPGRIVNVFTAEPIPFR